MGTGFYAIVNNAMGYTPSFLKKTLESQKTRFVLVGITNTAVDFAVLFSLVLAFHMPSSIANIFSTTCALIVSYFLNKRTVFGDTDRHNKRQVVSFIAVTLSGIWIVQTIAIFSVSTVLNMIMNFDMTLVLFISKIAASVASLVWNYIWYSRVIFKKRAS
jgi:putative flippase GtrA